MDDSSWSSLARSVSIWAASSACLARVAARFSSGVGSAPAGENGDRAKSIISTTATPGLCRRRGFCDLDTGDVSCPLDGRRHGAQRGHLPREAGRRLAAQGATGGALTRPAPGR